MSTKNLKLTALGATCAAMFMFPQMTLAGECSAVAGSIEATVIGGDPVNVLGVVSGDLAGAVRAVITSQAEGENGTVLLGLSHDFVTNDHASLKTNDKAVWTPVPDHPGVFYMTTSYEIVGGTGKYDGATGSLQNSGTADTNTGLLTLRYSGQVCTS